MNVVGRLRKWNGFVGRLRAPAYAGANRCLPRTVVNVAILLVLGGLLATRSPSLASVVVTGMLIVIYLRGYLVPGTPTLTTRYLPDRILAYFGHHAELAGSRDSPDPEQLLLDAGVLVDPSSLDRLFQGITRDGDSVSTRVSFRYMGFDIEVDGSGWISVRESGELR